MKFSRVFFFGLLFCTNLSAMRVYDKVKREEKDRGSTIIYCQKSQKGSEQSEIFITRKILKSGQSLYSGHLNDFSFEEKEKSYLFAGTLNFHDCETTKKIWYGLNYEFVKNMQKLEPVRDIIGYFEQVAIKNQ